jgi:phospholipid transport system substrate-binding protein
MTRLISSFDHPSNTLSFRAPSLTRSVGIAAAAICLSLSALPLPAVAQNAPAAGATIARPAASAAADAAVKAAVEGTVSAINADAVAKNGDPARTAQLVEAHFLPYTDFRRTARLAAGDAWKQATPAQQEQIFQQFQALLVRVYAAQLTQTQGQNIKFVFEKPTPVAGSTDAVVKSTVHTDTDDASTAYRLVKTADGYKIYDIDLMGLWLIQIYQQQFRDQVRQGGIDGLIKFLAAHNAQRAAG